MVVIEKIKSKPFEKKYQTWGNKPETKRKKGKNNDTINSANEGNSKDAWKCKFC